MLPRQNYCCFLFLFLFLATFVCARKTIEATLDESSEIIFSDRASRSVPIGIIDLQTQTTFAAETFVVKVRSGTDRASVEAHLRDRGMTLRKRLNAQSFDDRLDTYLVEFQETSSILTKNLVAAQLNGMPAADPIVIEATQFVEAHCTDGRFAHHRTAEEKENENENVVDRILEKLVNFNAERGHKSFYQWSQELYKPRVLVTSTLMRRVQKNRLCNVTWENVLWVPAKDELADYMSQASTAEHIIKADRNAVFELRYTPNDPLLSPHLSIIKAYQAWDITKGSANVVVGIIDSGMFFGHEDLQGQAWTNVGEIAGNGIDDDHNGYVDDTKGWDCVNNDNNPDDDLSSHHGTHVAGTIGATINNGKGVTGVSPIVRMMVLKAFDASGFGSDSDIIECLYYAIDNGARLTSNSYGGGGYSSSFYSAIAASRAANMLFVVAAGNEATNNDVSPSYPASYNLDNIITVAASIGSSSNGVVDTLTGFSNYGAVSVDIATPGDYVISTVKSGASTSTYAAYAGTSMSTPQVSSAAVLIHTLQPSWNYSQVRQRILSTVDPLVAPYNGRVSSGGRLNLQRAVTIPTPPPPPKTSSPPPPPPKTSSSSTKTTSTTTTTTKPSTTTKPTTTKGDQKKTTTMTTKAPSPTSTRKERTRPPRPFFHQQKMINGEHLNNPDGQLGVDIDGSTSASNAAAQFFINFLSVMASLLC